MRIEYDNARDGALVDFSLVVQRTGLGVLEQVIWMLQDLVGRNGYSISVFPAVVPVFYYVAYCYNQLQQDFPS